MTDRPDDSGVARALHRALVLSPSLLLVVIAARQMNLAMKVVAGEYPDGSFLHDVFLTDSRVAVAASIAGQVSLQELQANRELQSMLAWLPSSESAVQYSSSSALSAIAVASSWWTLFIEGAIALLWLVPRFREGAAKDIALALFVLTTYVLLPVVGFATVLAIMAYSVATLSGHKRIATVHLAVLAAVQLASIPWGGPASRLLAT